MKHEHLYAGLSAAVIALSVVPVGVAVFLLGFAWGDSPCVVCWEQRIGMLLVALAGVFILRYGPRPRYIGVAVLVAAWGVFMSMRHTSMHAARDIGQGFSIEVFGVHTYAWALLVYWACLVMMGTLLLLLDRSEAAPAVRKPSRFDRIAMLAFLVIVGANIVQAFASTGPPPFMGQGDPVRFSFNPRLWHWSMDEWGLSPVSLRGRWGAQKPGVASIDADRRSGPFPDAPTLRVVDRRRLMLALEGPPTGLAYDQATDRFLVTTTRGLYISDGALQRILRYAIVDPEFSVDLGDLTAGVFLDSHTVMALSENKSFVVLRENERADPARNEPRFLASSGGVEEVTRGRLTTVRARMMYVMSLAFDPDAKALYTLTVPNGRTRQLVVSQFDRRDFTLSAEFLPTTAPSVTWSAPRRSLDDLYVSAATWANGRLYALSAAHNLLLVADVLRHAIVEVSGIDTPAPPRGIAVRQGALYVICADGTLLRAELPTHPGISGTEAVVPTGALPRH